MISSREAKELYQSAYSEARLTLSYMVEEGYEYIMAFQLFERVLESFEFDAPLSVRERMIVKAAVYHAHAAVPDIAQVIG